MKRLLILLVFVQLACQAVAEEKKFYRYKDENGQVVINTFIPPERVPFGYEVLNESGRVLETVARQLSKDELEQVSEERKRQEEEEKARKAQREYDLSLIRRYSFVTDIEAEKERKIKEMQVRATILKGNLNSVRAELEAEYDRAAKAERAGGEVPVKVKERIAQLEAKITTTEELLQKREAAVEETRKEYLRAIERFKEIQKMRGK